MSTLAYEQFLDDELPEGKNPLEGYLPGNNDEVLSVTDNGIFARPGTEDLVQQLAGMSVGQLHNLQLSLNAEIRRAGITFTVYNMAKILTVPGHLMPYHALLRLTNGRESKKA